MKTIGKDIRPLQSYINYDHCARPTHLATGNTLPFALHKFVLLRAASDGDLEWFLRQGDLRHGMPSWSGLPQAQRWQIIAYLRSLK
jgi:hypothetical protein